MQQPSCRMLFTAIFHLLKFMYSIHASKCHMPLYSRSVRRTMSPLIHPDASQIHLSLQPVLRDPTSLHPDASSVNAYAWSWWVQACGNGASIAPVGLVGMLNPGGAVYGCSIKAQGESAVIQLDVKGCGPFLLHSTRPAAKVMLCYHGDFQSCRLESHAGSCW